MSFLGGSSKSGSAVNTDRMEMATREIDLITDLFSRLVSSCHNKCVSPRYAEPDLNKGESVCIDRCVAKFFEVNKKVDEKLQTVGSAAGGRAAFGMQS